MRRGGKPFRLRGRIDSPVPLEELEQTTEALALRHDTLAANTRNQLKQVFEAIRKLMSPPESKRRPIGLITPEEKKRG
ncbi:MAG: hypothetical protein ACTS6J_11300 [Burkholderiales bacterium]